jgi:hypothetical protein
MTFEEMRKVEPRLTLLEAHIKQIGRKHEQPFCANGLWFCHFKPALSELVGWRASVMSLAMRKPTRQRITISTVCFSTATTKDDSAMANFAKDPSKFEEEWREDGRAEDGLYGLYTHLSCGAKVQILLGHDICCPKCHPDRWAENRC